MHQVVGGTWLNGNIAVDMRRHMRLWFVILCRWPDHWRWNLYLKARLSSRASSRGCEMYIWSRQRWRRLSRDVINDQICLQLRGLGHSCDWYLRPAEKGRHPSVTGQKRHRRLNLSFHESSFSNNPHGTVLFNSARIILWICQRVVVKFCKGNPKVRQSTNKRHHQEGKTMLPDTARSSRTRMLTGSKCCLGWGSLIIAAMRFLLDHLSVAFFPNVTFVWICCRRSVIVSVTPVTIFIGVHAVLFALLPFIWY